MLFQWCLSGLSFILRADCVSWWVHWKAFGRPSLGGRSCDALLWEPYPSITLRVGGGLVICPWCFQFASPVLGVVVPDEVVCLFYFKVEIFQPLFKLYLQPFQMCYNMIVDLEMEGTWEVWGNWVPRGLSLLKISQVHNWGLNLVFYFFGGGWFFFFFLTPKASAFSVGLGGAESPICFFKNNFYWYILFWYLPLFSSIFFPSHKANLYNKE